MVSFPFLTTGWLLGQFLRGEWSHSLHPLNLRWIRSPTGIFSLNDLSLIRSQVDKSGTLVDLGCGNGRDAVFFAKNGAFFEILLYLTPDVKLVYAIDLSQASIDHLNETTNQIDHITFIQGDFSELKSKKELNINNLDAVPFLWVLN